MAAPLAQFLGNNLRRVKESMSTLEQELISKIKAGEFPALEIGKLEHYKGSHNPVQHFIVKSNG